MEKSRILVQNEIGELQEVLIHRPDRGISRMDPSSAKDLLFDDIVDVRLMQKEHDVFTDVLRFFSNVLEAENLLLEGISANSHLVNNLLEVIIDWEEMPHKYLTKLQSLEPEELATALVEGYIEKEDLFLFNPIPNFIFTRDVAVVINDHLLLTKANKSARFRENHLIRFIFSANPRFAHLEREGRIIDMNDKEVFSPGKKGEKISIEGGDIMIINDDCVLIGESERTTLHAIESLTETLFEKKLVSRVARISIPKVRSYMHIDTLFTQISKDHIVGYQPIVMDGEASKVTLYVNNGEKRVFGSFRDFYLSEINNGIKFIPVGGGISPYQEREQWTDGCNLVAIKPGVALIYDRNYKTIDTLREYGYKIKPAVELLNDARENKISPDKTNNMIITLPSSELSRARGGSHCMTCPLHRKTIKL